MKKIILIGSGNVATHLGLSLFNKGYNIKQVWSKHLTNAKLLASKLNSTATNNLKNLEEADLYIVSVKDNVLELTIKQLKVKNIVHTSGTIGLEIFNSKIKNYGVFYPLQTFNKKVNLDFTKTPICIESKNKSFEKELLNIGNKISEKVLLMSSDQRKQLHIAAVFACNFTNHMFSISYSILAKSNIDFKLLLPIINQTVMKIKHTNPIETQTGPAKRKDKNIIESHINNISENETREIYKLITESIMKENE